MNTNATSPALVKKIEKGIMKEAKNEDQNLKQAIKDLSQTEKAETKAQKAAIKAEQQLMKLEKYEQSTLNALHKATHDHDIAATKTHSAETDLEMKRRQHQKLQRGVDEKKLRVENAMKVNEEHSKLRESKLAELHESPSRNFAQGQAGAPPEYRRVSGGYDASPRVAQIYEGKDLSAHATQSLDPRPLQ
ncbi:hypothetical protein K443DRAFT_672451 [Laccaria amethystina LaAM-08-1]|uniref:Unplaced genomic scaffold K443scaffold_7, whole genome shotgun sequence n=1 Tax=Laccaria amethystina LaAM-08-1 TaxID=1095629 RepID=A0A0C9YDK3_9AGAR|nr:hypothetical protein K443DRAFT_672451 [Laccaria amethystina LaAM-08-1]